MKKLVCVVALLLLIVPAVASAKTVGMKVTNEMIYQKLIEIEKHQAVLEAEFREFKESTNKRFEDMNKRFDQLYTFLWIITGIFTAIMVGAFGFAYWDRRTIIAEAKRQTLEELEKDVKPEKLRRLLNVVREYAKENEKLREILKKEGLL